MNRTNVIVINKKIGRISLRESNDFSFDFSLTTIIIRIGVKRISERKIKAVYNNSGNARNDKICSNIH